MSALLTRPQPTPGGHLGQQLLARGLVTGGQLAIALADQRERKALTLGDALVARGFLAAAQLEAIRADLLEKRTSVFSPDRLTLGT